MRTLAVVAIRGTVGAKTRLAPRFAEAQRAALAWTMLRHVLRQIRLADVADHILIVTRESEEAARQAGSAPDQTILRQPVEHAGLNPAFDLARSWAQVHEFESMLLLHPDLPLLGVADLQCLVEPETTVVIAPDRAGNGTNALLLRLAGHDPAAARHFTFAFGPWSYHRHTAEAERLSTDIETIRTHGLGWDLDDPDDWEALPEPVRQHLLVAIREMSPAAAT